MKCKSCGEEISKKIKFCPICGTKIITEKKMGRKENFLANPLVEGLKISTGIGLKAFRKTPVYIQTIVKGGMLLLISRVVPGGGMFGYLQLGLAGIGLLFMVSGVGLMQKATQVKKKVKKKEV